jgi:protein MpaA
LIAEAAAAVAVALTGAPPDALSELRRTVAPERAVQRQTAVTIGQSSAGRPITATARNGVPNSWSWRRGGPLVLAFGCIHGDECAGVDAVKRAISGPCPPPGDGLVVVDNLNPDGLALGSRLNARGVDLNRNFATDWLASGVAGDPEYPGPRPFSEPETRIARRLIRALRPDVTIWFHQQAEALVRAWGPSVPAARLYARLAGLPFVPMPWMAGTAPNWQNAHFPATSAFVVELPDDGPVDAEWVGAATVSLAGALMRRADG